MAFIAVLGLTAGVCTSVAALPQIVTTIKTKQAKDISPAMFTVMLVGNCLWVLYGFAKSDLPIILTNLITVILDITMLFLKYKYRRNR